MKSAFVVGDVHGCLDELRRLLDEAKVTSGDEVFLVGDLVNKGPDSIGVVRFCRDNGIAAVLGNHDDSLLRCIASQRGDGGERFSESISRIARDIAAAETAWLRALPLWLRIPRRRALVVHAGLIPGISLAAQKRGSLLAIRSVLDDGSGSERADAGVPWGSLYRGPSHVFFGHDAARGLQRWRHATGLDTGCVYGGRLTGYDVDRRSFVSVAARRVYATTAGERRRAKR